MAGTGGKTELMEEQDALHGPMGRQNGLDAGR